MRRVIFLTLVSAAIVLPAAQATAESAADIAMGNQIGQKLKESGRLRNYRIGVKYEDGVVWLEGTVADAAQRDAAVGLTKQIRGVMHVVNRLEIASETKPEQVDVGSAFRKPAIESMDNAEGETIAASAPMPRTRTSPQQAPALSGAPVDQTIESLAPLLQKGDALIDGGNSNYKDSMRRAAALRTRGIEFVDVGTSGGIWGLREGYSMMIGGAKPVVDRLRPIFETLAPSAQKGWGHVGPSGAGHFVKMVHNGIEYGLMQAYAEGFSILEHKKDFSLDLHQVAEIWRSGSVVRSWLLDLIAAELSQDPGLDAIAPVVADSGEGRWTVAEAVDLNVPAPVITLSLIERLSSRDSQSFSRRLLAAMRHQFGGHAIEAPPKK